MWSKVHKYPVTFYHRPCKVLKCLGSEIRVQVLDSGRIFVVDAYKFELEPGDKLIHSTTKENLIFIKYLKCDYIQCRNLANEVKWYKIQDIEGNWAIFYV